MAQSPRCGNDQTVVYSGSQKRGPISLFKKFDLAVFDTNPDFFVRIVDQVMIWINSLKVAIVKEEKYFLSGSQVVPTQHLA